MMYDMKLPKSNHGLGYTNKEVEAICKIYNVSFRDMLDDFIGNTGAFHEGEFLNYHCDVVNSLNKLINGEYLFFD